MEITPTAARWLRMLPKAAAARLIDAVTAAAARLPETSANVKPIHHAPGVWQLRHHKLRVLFTMRDGEPVILAGATKAGRNQYRAIMQVRRTGGARLRGPPPDHPRNQPLLSLALRTSLLRNTQQGSA